MLRKTIITMEPSLEECEKRLLMYGPGSQPPQVVWISGSNPIIGSSNDIQVNATSTPIKSVTYSVQGPDDVVIQQNWFNNVANNTTTKSITHSWTNGQEDPYQFQDNWDFWWGATPGHYTVTVHTVYSDKDSTSYDTSKSFDVTKPTVTDFRIVGTAQAFNSIMKPGFIGFGQTARTGHYFSDYFVATVSTPVAGSFGFIQKIDSSWARMQTTTQTITMKSPANTEILDLNDGNTPYVQDIMYGINRNESLVIGGPDDVGDSPHLMAKLYNPVLGVIQTIKYRLFLTTYIDFKPSNGIHVLIAKADWNLGGSATYQDANADAQPEPPHWTVFNPHDEAWTVNGTEISILPEWDTNWTNIKNDSTTVTFPPQANNIDYNPDDLVFIASRKDRNAEVISGKS